MVGSTISLIFLTRTTDRSAEVDQHLAWLEARTPPPLVDVFICTYNEEEAILERTIVGALLARLPALSGVGARRWTPAVACRPRSPPRRSISHAVGQFPRQGRQHQQRPAPRRGPARAARLHQHPRRRLRACAELPAPRTQPVPRGRRRHRPDAAALHQSRSAAEQPLDRARLAGRAALFLRRRDGGEGRLGRLVLLRHVLGHPLRHPAGRSAASRPSP